MQRPDNRVVLGRGGLGKSYLVQHWLKKDPTLKNRPIVICDPNREDGYAEGSLIVEGPPRGVAAALMAGHKRLCWWGNDEWLAPARLPDALDALAAIVLACERACLVAEEVDEFCRGGQLPPAFYQLIKRGRHRDCRVISCSQRPALVPRLVTANASRIVAFHTTEPNDLDYFRRLAAGLPAAISALKTANYEAVDWTDGEITVKKSPFR